jgi:hypothetical protein
MSIKTGNQHQLGISSGKNLSVSSFFFIPFFQSQLGATGMPESYDIDL